LSGANEEIASSSPQHMEALQHTEHSVYSLAAICIPGDARDRSCSLCKEHSSARC